MYPSLPPCNGLGFLPPPPAFLPDRRQLDVEVYVCVCVRVCVRACVRACVMSEWVVCVCVFSSRARITGENLRIIPRMRFSFLFLSFFFFFFLLFKWWLARADQIHFSGEGSVQRGSAMRDDRWWAFLDELRASSFPWWVPHTMRGQRSRPTSSRGLGEVGEGNSPGDFGPGKAPDSWSKGCEFESQQERRENFLLQS